MPITARIYVANDNDPPHVAPKGDVVGFRALVVDRQREYLTQNSLDDALKVSQNPLLSFGLSIAIWGLALGGLVWTYATQQSLGYKIIASVATIWAGIWIAFVGQDHERNRVAEFGILSAIAGFSAILTTAISQVGLPLTLSEAMAIFITGMLFLTLILRSHIAMLCSISAVILWAALFIDGYLLPSTVFWSVPLFIAVQIGLSLRHKFKFAGFLAAVSIYVWLAGLGYQEYLEGRLSLLYLVSGLFMLGCAHFRLAKAGEVTDIGNMSPHLTLAWTTAAIALIAVQHFLTFPTDFIWSGALENAPLNMAIWTGLCGLSTVLILFSGFLRRYYARMFISSIILMTLIAAIVPFLIWQHDASATFVEQSLDTPAYPFFAATLLGAVSASALFYCLNNVRRQRYISAAIGGTIILAQLYLISISEIYWTENILIAAVSFIVSLCVIIMLGHINEIGTTHENENGRWSISL